MKLLITGGSGFIGTNLVDLLLTNQFSEFINVDKQSPLNRKHDAFWKNCNIMDKEKLNEIIQQYKPTHVVHLAARTDTASDILSDYEENTVGTENLIKILEHSDFVEYVIVTSTQYVYKSNETPNPISDQDFKPHTAYGISKKLTEETTRNSAMKCSWTIIRPTNVWGPWNMRYPNEFFKIIDKGLYFHPKNVDPVKSYAYVKNVVHQISKMLEAPASQMHKKVFYVGDLPMHSMEWINAFTMELTGKKLRTFPKTLLQLISYGGDIVKKIGIPFPLHSERFNNMIDNYPTPMEKTIDEFGMSNPKLEKNVSETINWIKGEGKQFFPYWRNK